MSINLADLPTLEETGRDHGKVLIHGEPGTGKTTLATSIAEVAKTLYVYFPGEQGIASIPRAYSKSITPVLVRSVEEEVDLLWSLQLEDHPYEAVVIEGIAAWQNLYTRWVQNIPEGGPKSAEQVKARKASKHVDMRRVGGDVGGFIKDQILFWYSLADHTRAKPIHVVMTSQTKRREIREKTEDPNATGALIEVQIGPDVFPAVANTVEGTPDFIGYTFIASDPNDMTGEAPRRHCVRFGSHEEIRTKLHQDVTARRRWPDVVGLDGKRLTLPKFLRAMEVIGK